MPVKHQELSELKLQSELLFHKTGFVDFWKGFWKLSRWGSISKNIQDCHRWV